VRTDDKRVNGSTIESSESLLPAIERESPSWRKKRKPSVRDMGLVRITVDLSDRQHHKLRVAALNQRITARQLIIDLLTREGITDEE
jgi:hypothetical protein